MLISKIKVVVWEVARDRFGKKIKSLCFIHLFFCRIFTMSFFDFGHLNVVSIDEAGAFLDFLHQRLWPSISLQVPVNIL